MTQEVNIAFWDWWRGAASRIAVAIDSGTVTELVDEISTQVKGLHPQMAWELGKGAQSQHALTMSPEGNKVLRRLSERWVRSGPPPDETWEYYPARQPADGYGLTISGQTFEPDAWRFMAEIDRDHLLANLTCYHPALSALTDLQRSQAGFIAIDQMVGEDATEKWLGRLEFTAHPLNGGSLWQGVATLIAEMAEESTNEVFRIAQGADSHNRPLFLTYNARLKWLDHLFAETVVHVDLPLRRPTDKGLPTNEEAAELNDLEHLLLEAAEGEVYVGRLTGRGMRTLHFYAEDARHFWDRLSAVLDAHPEWGGSLRWEPDPEWEFYTAGLFSEFQKP